ncbi:MAG: polyhydroxyalkanoate synthesis regulator DNA-binding domain-containing protein [Sandaracinaceae bacterium]
MSGTRIVKRYGNRRLYDTTESRYITMEELAGFVREGTRVSVQDAKTGRDLTQQTLAHIILESRGASRLLPIPLLEQLIRMGDDSLTEFFGMYVSSALEMYFQAKANARALMPYGNPFLQVPMAATNALARMMGNPMMGGWNAQVPPAQPGMPPPSMQPIDAPIDDAEPEEDDTKDQVAALRRELQELKEALRSGRSE